MKKLLFMVLLSVLISVVGIADTQFMVTQNPTQLEVPTALLNVKPIVVQLFKDVPFANAPKPAVVSVNLPQGKWSKIVLEINGTQKGRQFDRIMEIMEDGIELFVGITPEPTKKGITWHITKDITQFMPLLSGKHTFKMEIGNYVTGIYTGIPKMSARLLFYPRTNGKVSILKTIGEPVGEKIADEIVPVFKNKNWMLEAVGTRKTNKTIEATVTCPSDVKAVVLHLYVLGQMNDEFWWTNQPAFREVEVCVDGKPAGVVWPFPYVYTGGVNPLLWRPMVSINAFDIPTYSVDLTPFAGILHGTHIISLKIIGNAKYWLVSGYLSIYTTHGRPTSGKILLDSLKFPTSAITEESSALHNKGNQILDQTATKEYKICGIVKTSEGSWKVTDEYSLKFANDQTNLAENYWQLVHAFRIASSKQTVVEPNGNVLAKEKTDTYTIDCAGAYILNKKYKAFLLPANLSQMLTEKDKIEMNGATIFWSRRIEMLEGYANLEEDNKVATVKEGDTSGYYIYQDSEGHSYHRLVITRGGKIIYGGD